MKTALFGFMPDLGTRIKQSDADVIMDALKGDPAAGVKQPFMRRKLNKDSPDRKSPENTTGERRVPEARHPKKFDLGGVQHQRKELA